MGDKVEATYHGAPTEKQQEGEGSADTLPTPHPQTGAGDQTTKEQGR